MEEAGVVRKPIVTSLLNSVAFTRWSRCMRSSRPTLMNRPADARYRNGGLSLALGDRGCKQHLEDRVFCVIAGTLSVRVNDECSHVLKGGCVVIPRGTPHTFENQGSGPLRFYIFQFVGRISSGVGTHLYRRRRVHRFKFDWESSRRVQLDCGGWYRPRSAELWVRQGHRQIGGTLGRKAPQGS